MKPELDALFLAGINHVFYHGDAYSPEDVPWPGWLFYASTQANTRNPLWRDLGDGLNTYIARCQSLLQSGSPDNDLLVYWPDDDLWHNPEGQMIQLTVDGSWLKASATGKLMEALTAKGFAYDLISTAQLAQTNVEQGKLRTPGGLYRTIVVPKTEHMAVDTLQRLLALAKAGATVLFIDSLPSDVPGFGRLAERRNQLKSELARLDLKSDGAGRSWAKSGRGSIKIAPLAALPLDSREPMADAGLQFIRRKLDDGCVYFIANQTSQPFEGWVPLRQEVKSAVLMNPRQGDAGVARIRQNHGVTEVYLQQAAGESIFIRTFTSRNAAGQPVRYVRPTGEPITLSGGWKATAVRGGPELPPAFVQRGFGSWTVQGGEWERFGGTARYEIEFELPAGVKADDWLLDLGDVRETARVFVNEQEADLVWSLPMHTKIGRFLKPGRNVLALEVTNLAANRIRDLEQRGVAWKNFYEINFVNIFYQPFNGAIWPLQPSGLLGPVKLVPLSAFTP